MQDGNPEANPGAISQRSASLIFYQENRLFLVDNRSALAMLTFMPLGPFGCSWKQSTREKVTKLRN